MSCWKFFWCCASEVIRSQYLGQNNKHVFEILRVIHSLFRRDSKIKLKYRSAVQAPYSLHQRVRWVIYLDSRGANTTLSELSAANIIRYTSSKLSFPTRLNSRFSPNMVTRKSWSIWS